MWANEVQLHSWRMGAKGSKAKLSWQSWMHISLWNYTLNHLRRGKNVTTNRKKKGQIHLSKHVITIWTLNFRFTEKKLVKGSKKESFNGQDLSFTKKIDTLITRVLKFKWKIVKKLWLDDDDSRLTCPSPSFWDISVRNPLSLTGTSCALAGVWTSDL
jgi:hypothetical protein